MADVCGKTGRAQPERRSRKADSAATLLDLKFRRPTAISIVSQTFNFS
jgi:hypothetical protein